MLEYQMKRTRRRIYCMLAAFIGFLPLNWHAHAQVIEPSKLSNPETGYLHYETEHCTADVEVSLTLRRFDQAKFDNLLDYGRVQSEALCRTAATKKPLDKPYNYALRWRIAAMVPSLDLIALSGEEFRFDGGITGKTVAQGLVYDRSAARELELEDFFISREIMLSKIVPLARKALAEQKQEYVGVNLTDDELEALLPDEMNWPGMRWGIKAAPRGFRFSGIWLNFPQGAFETLNGKDLTGRASSEGSAILILDQSDFNDSLKQLYLEAFVDGES